MRACVKCGGSWAGAKPYDSLCAHDFDEAPVPDVTPSSLVRSRSDLTPTGEMGWIAYGGGSMWSPASHWVQHPTREGAIAAWQQSWRERRDRERANDLAVAAELAGDVASAVATYDYGKFLGGTDVISWPLRVEGVPHETVTKAPAGHEPRWRRLTRADLIREQLARDEAILREQGVAGLQPWKAIEAERKRLDLPPTPGAIGPVWGSAEHVAKVGAVAGPCDCGAKSWAATDIKRHGGADYVKLRCTCGGSRFVVVPAT